MDLIFTKQADRWVAEFLATDDFNLHIEGVVEGNVSVFQRGSESGNYAFVKEGTPHPSYANVYDYDFAALIYPKFIKVSCATEPTSGIVTSDGEITEIKAQTKEIEVTSNGTTTVAPDEGFAYLNKVSVKTNVPQSGGGSEGGSASTMEYLDTSGAGEVEFAITGFSLLAKAYRDGVKYVTTTASLAFIGIVGAGATPNAVAIDFNAKIVYGELITTIKDFLIAQGITADQLAAIPRITEEEFYTL